MPYLNSEDFKFTVNKKKQHIFPMTNIWSFLQLHATYTLLQTTKEAMTCKLKLGLSRKSGTKRTSNI